ncbi:uncharacterized protein LOC135129964 [Zophobas morio]|uniref:uncharacterized protein LOC135129964 n=1 Tax=Zophobas morio TaxID=2755281 RepID=UPI00308376D8
MKGVKVRYNNITKWMILNEAVSFPDFCADIQKKFSIDGNIILMDTDGAEIEEDVFQLFITTNESITFVAVTKETRDCGIFSSGYTNLDSPCDEATPSCSSVSTLTTTSSLDEGLYLNEIFDLRSQIRQSGGQYILDEYEKNQFLTDRTRIHLVNIVANILFNIYQHNVPKLEKMKYAEEIVTIFPNLKNPVLLAVM